MSLEAHRPVTAWRDFAPAASDFRLLAACAVLLLLLMGCVRTTDFGRLAKSEPQPNFETTGDPAYTGAIVPPLTDDEKQLRMLANNLLAGPYERKAALAIGQRPPPGYTPTPEASPDAYVSFLLTGPFRSASARYARLIDDTRNDVTRLDQFFNVARRVADLDRKRERSLGVSNLAPEEVLNARRRVRENMMLMTEVQHVMRERAAMYRFALERLVAGSPSPMAVDAERTRAELERKLSSVQVVGDRGAAVVAR